MSALLLPELPVDMSQTWSEKMTALKWQKIPVLNDGFVCLVDGMGDESAIVQAARVSYGEGTKTPSDDRTLIRYLMRHRHCYAPWMQVLTARGWVRWDECCETESFAVPDPASRTMRFETLPVESFAADDGLHVFENERMSYAVTPDHRMWFKPKYQQDFKIIPVQDMPVWGHFDPLQGYILHSPPTQTSGIDGDFAASINRLMCELVGFYLGDGSYASANTVTFHLRKDCKKDYLRNLCSGLGIELRERQSTTYADAVVFAMDTPTYLRDVLGDLLSCRSSDKGIPTENWRLGDVDWCGGIRAGLEASDQHDRGDREQVRVRSTSPKILQLYQAVCAMAGVDAHEGRTADGVGVATSFSGDRTTLESRKRYHNFHPYEGRVFCTTTSTGLLMVRGGTDEFAFVCGNTTPLEMVELKFLIRVPMDCWRQWIRHRTASVNEYSTRYSEAIDSQQTTLPGEWRLQSGVNKQGSDGGLTEWPDGWKVSEQHYGDEDTGEMCWLIFAPDSVGDEAPCQIIPVSELGTLEPRKPTPGEVLSYLERESHAESNGRYKLRLALGVAREQARKDLPLSTYTEAYWKIDLHNLLHFLGLRMDTHAQLEIRQYANTLGAIVASLYPNVWQAFQDYRLDAQTLTALDIAVVQRLVASGVSFPASVPEVNSAVWPVEWATLRCRERDEAITKLQSMAILRREAPTNG